MSLVSYLLQTKILSCLKTIRDIVEISDFFKSHEVSPRMLWHIYRYRIYIGGWGSPIFV